MIIKRKYFSALNLAFTGLDATMTTSSIVKSSKEHKQSMGAARQEIKDIQNNTAAAIKEQKQAGENFRNSLKI